MVAHALVPARKPGTQVKAKGRNPKTRDPSHSEMPLCVLGPGGDFRTFEKGPGRLLKQVVDSLLPETNEAMPEESKDDLAMLELKKKKLSLLTGK